MIMRLKRNFATFPVGSFLHFEPSTASDVAPGDIVLAGIDDAQLFLHVVKADGELTDFGCICGERRNIRYRATAATSEL